MYVAHQGAKIHANYKLLLGCVGIVVFVHTPHMCVFTYTSRVSCIHLTRVSYIHLTCVSLHTPHMCVLHTPHMCIFTYTSHVYLYIHLTCVS